MPGSSSPSRAPSFRVNGTSARDSEEYAELLDAKFATWRLKIDGLVDRPQALSLADLRRLPARTQITRHDCVEGWSAIGKWTGAPLGTLLRAAGLKANARYAVFHCADELERSLDGSGRYYESIDLVDAFHPQTILAYAMNGEDLSVGHGAPLRLRVERQLGYKQAKYITRIEIVAGWRLRRGRSQLQPPVPTPGFIDDASDRAIGNEHRPGGVGISRRGEEGDIPRHIAGVEDPGEGLAEGAQAGLGGGIGADMGVRRVGGPGAREDDTSDDTIQRILRSDPIKAWWKGDMS